MKQIYKILFIVTLISFTSCSDDFLNLVPQDELSEATTFSTYNNVKLYAWSFYDFFETYARSTGGIHATEPQADLIQNGGSTVGPAYSWSNLNVPATSATWNNTYANIRVVNIMLDNIVNSDMTEEEIAHWRGVGLFFRAHEYFKLLKLYGGVPWLETTLKDTDLEKLYGPRDSRDVVAGNMLRDLLEATETVKEEGDGPNTINKNVVKAFISRFGLFEGTWRKYHNLGDQEKYLDASIKASRELMDKYPTIHPNYDQVYNSEDLGNKDGIILYKHFVVDILTHWNSTNTRSTNNKYDITRKGIDKFLCKDGLTVHNSPLFEGDKDPYAEFRNRDTRLLVMTPPPYKIIGNGSVDTWTFTEDPADQEYFPVLKSITGGFPYKELPDANWSGRATGEVPNFDLLAPTQTGNGYRLWKIYNDLNPRVSSADINDFPIFRIGEVMLNYAEATWEMGTFNQAIADETINKLRARGEVAPMDVNSIDAAFDPTRDPSVDPVLFEIRRERAIELMADGFRREDLRRWKKMDYATEVQLGRWIKQADYTKTIPIQNDAAEGYVQLIPGQAPPFPEHSYLFPLPSDEIVLNPQLTQNTGW
ncbi:RagB/SusD family nutrient uptake outer membrane protein [Portibacter lacus]|uniref:Membrane protein n=1 Tax=Portibacter lacus TaxID=1099794 RepID=A0AA37SUA0_9BACT|nr:RagB/SusD family nutrient uptake outer membrane protein [Portibacter lacus]GLR18891.1 membrane protein [Portibacter lacus]